MPEEQEKKVSESELQDLLRRLLRDMTAEQAKLWWGAQRAHDCYPKAGHCGRCGARKGGCVCSVFPYLSGSDVLYQLSRLHAQNVSHMMRMGLSTWDILSGAEKCCRRCGQATCYCPTEPSCSRCRCKPCRCSGPVAHPPKGSHASSSVTTVTDRWAFDPQFPKLSPHTMLQRKNRSDQTVEVTLHVPDCFIDAQGRNFPVYPRTHLSSREVHHQGVASAYVYFDLRDTKDASGPLWGVLELLFNDQVVASTKLYLDLKGRR